MNTDDMPQSTSWGLVFALTAAGVAVAGQVGKGVAALPAVSTDLGLSLTQGSWILSAGSVAGALGGLAFGAGADRIGHRRALLIGLLLTAAASSVGAAAENLPILLLTRLIEGVGFTATTLSAPPLLVRITAPRHRSVVLGLWSSFNPAGMGGATLVGPWLISAIGWRGLWLVSAALLLLIAASLAPATRRLSAPAFGTATPSRGVIRDVLRSRGILLAALVFAFYSAQFLAVFGLLPILLTGNGLLTPQAAAILTATAILITIPGDLLGGYLRGRGIPGWLLIGLASAVMTGSAFAIYAADAPSSLRYAACFVLPLAGGMIPAILFGAGPALTPRPNEAAATVGALMQGSTLGQALGPPALAILATAFGWQSSPIFIGLASVVTVGLGVALHRSIRSVPGPVGLVADDPPQRRPAASA